MIRLLVLVSLVAAAGEIIFLSLQGFSPRQGYAPKQPVAFSHKLHSGVMDVPCQYCHTQVSKGRHATVPSGNICMNCHEHVDRPSGADAPSPEIAKVKTAYKAGKSIEWVNVFDLPDHVYFNHQPHVHAGVACETCHGEIKKMDVVKTAVTLNMGWCLDCHRSQPGHINVPVYGEDQQVLRHVQQVNIKEQGEFNQACETTEDCGHSQVCLATDGENKTCQWDSYGLSAHFDQAAPQSCTVCHN
tara:strand:+ start:389 stop:1120 length:732 start_codon:yes stop_codon:yes gene_type:complete